MILSLTFGTGWGGTLNSQITVSNTASGLVKGKEKFTTHPFENKVFIEELGQFKKSLEENKISFTGTILFAVNNPEFKAYFTTTGINFLFSKTEKLHEGKDQAHENDEPVTKWETVNMKWENPSPSMHLSAKEKAKSYFTYGRYGDNSQYDHVSAYKKLCYSNIYEGVDAEFELPEKGGIKYQFIVHAGFNFPDIAYRIDGCRNLFLDEKGDLHIESSIGNLIDKAPAAFTKSMNIPANYSITGNLIKIIAENKDLSLTEDMIIDPWITNPALPVLNNAYDLQEDSYGNVYINGGDDNNYEVQKYNSSGVLQWTHPYNCVYYGDIAVGNSGSVYLAEGILPARVVKLTSAGAPIYAITEGAENWRLSFNGSKTILAMGGNFSPNSLTKIDTATGAMVNMVSYPSDTWSIATDCNGDIYSLHHGASPCMLRKTNADFTPALSLVTSPGFCISGYNNVHSYATGFNALSISGPYLYIYDGLQLRRFLKSTLAFVNSVAVPNGAINDCSGVAFDYCGNIYVGTMTTVEKFDMQLNPLTSIPAPNIVYDILLALNGDLLVCGKNFVSNFGPTCPYPPLLTSTATSTNVSCNPGTATIMALGGTIPYSYIWQPGGQTTVTATGLTPGTYTYLVNDAFCQSKQDSVVVIQTSPLQLSLGVVNNESCVNSLNGSATVSAAGGTGPYSFSWNTSPVQTGASATGLPAGNYIAAVTDADLCTDTVHVTINTNPNPFAAFSNTTVCNTNSTQFTDNSTTSSGTISTRSWNFGDGSLLNTLHNPPYTYLNAGNFNVALIVINSAGCADTIIKPIQVYFNPSAVFSHSNVCFSDSMHFVNTSSVDNSTSIAGYLWKFGDGSPASNLTNPAHKYAVPGTYTVTLIPTALNGCKDTAALTVNAFDPPASAFYFNAICLYDSAHFINTSASPSMGTTASWSWSFGDGAALNTTVWSPSHIFAASGNYLVTLITSSSNLGCPDTMQTSIIVPPTPVANFTFTNVCLNQAMNFINSSTIASGSMAGRIWNFGDGTPLDTASSPSHIYMAPGTYNVTLIVTTDKGCKDTITKSVIVHPRPSVYFNVLDVCDRNTAFFSNFTTILPTDTINHLTWNLGDGSPLSSNFNVTHIYNIAGYYTVKLWVVSNFGCTDSITKTAIVHPNPISNFSNTSVCQSAPTIFSDSCTTALGSISTWSWNFGDGSALNGSANPSHLYASAGIKTVTLIVKNSFGCKDTSVKSVQIYYNPVAGFRHNNVCFGDTMHFTDTSAVNNSTSIGTYFWAFGDGSPTSNVQNPAHYYSNAGVYTVTLVTTTIDGCSNAASIPVKTFDAPVSDFTFSNTCLNNSAVFTNTSISPTMGTTASWSWDFGDGSALNTTAWSLSHLYAAPGNYQFTLITHSSNLGCPDTLKDSITVFPMPIANYSSADMCLNQIMNFNDLSIVSSGIIAGRLWNFGDGTLPNANPNPNHQFASPGTYPVSLIATTDNSCKDTMTKSVIVHPLPAVQFSAANVCEGSIVQFNDLSNISAGDTLHSWAWDFDDGSPVAVNQNTSHLYSSNGSYTVQLLVVSNFGCMDSISKISIINPNPIVYFTAIDTAGCEPLCVNFQNLSSISTGNNASRIWDFGDGSPASSLLNANHCYNNDSVFLPNYFTVTLSVTSDSGCVSVLSKNNFITVFPNPNTSFSVQPQTTTIVDPVISLTDLTVGADFWNWNFGDSDTSSAFNPLPHLYADTGTYTITLITSTLYNCIDTMHQTISIEPDFLFYIPSAFTPNDDGINDSFSGKGIFIIKYEMTIFDRWGNLIFFSDDINKPWDGKANHDTKTAQADLYIYSFKVTDINLRKHNYKGTVTLVK